MKKNLFFPIAGFLIWAVLLTSCDSNTPTSVTKAFLSAFAEYDYEGMADCLYLDIKDGDDVDKAKKKAADGLQFMFGLASAFGEELPEVKDFKVGAETISEDGETATVEYTVTAVFDGEEETSEEELELRKDSNGDWKVLLFD